MPIASIIHKLKSWRRGREKPFRGSETATVAAQEIVENDNKDNSEGAIAASQTDEERSRLQKLLVRLSGVLSSARRVLTSRRGIEIASAIGHFLQTTPYKPAQALGTLIVIVTEKKGPDIPDEVAAQIIRLGAVYRHLDRLIVEHNNQINQLKTVARWLIVVVVIEAVLILIALIYLVVRQLNSVT